ncbi:hypothetical protein [Natranaerobius trueperi]|uniref:MASE6 domain-containing protein n=1 Tax=Natranaerobius trueperi TaxID=759412 RepID=A0A226C195_9FIRM|nr:hypothetical protein [Natranaerobius trueperi]OWZ85033.1 hypothetical protein CDO51_01160 [Natranaerobius trueperi]
MLTLILYFNIEEYKDYALYWIAAVPPVVYLLLGRKIGGIVTFSFLSYMFIFIMTRIQGDFTSDSVYNIVIAVLAITVLISYYELCIQEAYDTLNKKNKELTNLSSTDHLTGLFNRFKLDQVLES